MISRRMTRAEMIRWLGDAISTETEKPFEMIDYVFVDECGQLLDELMGESAAVSDDEILGKIEKWKAAAEPAVKKKKSYRNIWKIAVAAAVVVCMSLAVLAVPTWREAIRTVLRLGHGTTAIQEDGISYFYDGKFEFYPDMEDFITNTKLGILSYKASDDSLQVTTIKHLSDTLQTIIVFNDPDVCFCIDHHIGKISDEIKNNSEEFITSYFEAYIEVKTEIDDISYNAYFIYNNDMYNIWCSNQSKLLNILNSLRPGG